MPSPIRFIEIFLCSIVGFLPCIMVLIYPCRDRLRLNSAFVVILTLLLAALQLGSDVANALGLYSNSFLTLVVWFIAHLIYGIMMLRVPFSTLLVALLPGLGLTMVVKIGSGLITNIFLSAEEFTFRHLGVMAAMEIVVFGIYMLLLKTSLASLFVAEEKEETEPEDAAIAVEAAVAEEAPPAEKVSAPEEVHAETAPKMKKPLFGFLKSKTKEAAEEPAIEESASGAVAVAEETPQEPEMNEAPKPVIPEIPKIEIKDEPEPEVKEIPKIEIEEEPAPEVKEIPKVEIREEPTPAVKEESKVEIKEEPAPAIKEEPKAEEKRESVSQNLSVNAAHLQTLQYSDLMERIAESNWIRQEFRRHVDALNYRLGKKQYEKLQTHLNALQRQFPKDAPAPYSDYAPLNPVLAYFTQQAAYCGAPLKADVSLPALLSVSEKDLVTLTGNLLNNAVDACKKQRSGDRKIAVTIGMRNSILKLTVENSFDVTVRKDESANYISDKYQEEGMGLMVCRRIVQRYQGKLDISDAEGIFKVTAFLKL